MLKKVPTHDSEDFKRYHLWDTAVDFIWEMPLRLFPARWINKKSIEFIFWKLLNGKPLNNPSNTETLPTYLPKQQK